MEMPFFQDQEFVQETVEKIGSTPSEFLGCTFIDCDFSKANFARFEFEDCTFIRCNLSLSKVLKTALREITFEDCKLNGVRWDISHDFNFRLYFYA